MSADPHVRSIVWRDLERLREMFGPEWRATLDRACAGDPECIADVLGAVTDFSADDWREASPPLAATAIALQDAAAVAFFGPERLGARAKKKTMAARLATLLRRALSLGAVTADSR